MAQRKTVKALVRVFAFVYLLQGPSKQTITELVRNK